LWRIRRATVPRARAASSSASSFPRARGVFLGVLFPARARGVFVWALGVAARFLRMSVRTGVPPRAALARALLGVDLWLYPIISLHLSDILMNSACSLLA